MKAYETAPSADLADTSKRADQEPSRRTVTGLFGTAQMLRPSYWAWVGPILIMLFGGFIRFYRLSQPNAVVFDETYYVPDANSILRHGVELNHV